MGQLIYHLQVKKIRRSWGERLREKFNLALLSKCKWKVLYPSNYISFKILKFRYGDAQSHVLDCLCFPTRKIVSSWWKDLVGLLSTGSAKCNWTSKVILCKIGREIVVGFGSTVGSGRGI